jgi:hypothetical protein
MNRLASGLLPLVLLNEASHYWRIAVAPATLDDFEYAAVIAGPSGDCCSVQITRSVHPQTEWVRTVRSIERNQHCGRTAVAATGLDDLENGAVVIGSADLRRSE